jgi:V8-like Glu-specific endopeptidase
MSTQTFNTRRIRQLLVCFGVAVTLGLGAATQAQTPVPPREIGEKTPMAWDSGMLDNPQGQPVVVESRFLRQPGAQSMRVFFGPETNLPPGSVLRIHSVLDGQVQELSAEGLAMWRNGTAFFNGSELLVELVAAPGSIDNRIVVSGLFHETPDPFSQRDADSECGVCGNDDRVQSSEDWVARLVITKDNGATSASTGFVFCPNSNYMGTCGHCIDDFSSGVVQFRVPNSSVFCTIINPLISDQFPIEAVQAAQNNGVGRDWGLIRIGRNFLNQTPFQRYGQFRQIAFDTPLPGATSVVYGYGVNSNCTVTSTQQFSPGTITAVNEATFNMNNESRPGNSGSPILVNNQIVGVATHCSDNGCSNTSQRADWVVFESARRSFSGNCENPPAVPFNDNPTFAPTMINTTVSGSTASATTSYTIVDLGTEPDREDYGPDVFWRFTPTCDGTYAFDTCGSAFDTTLAIYDADSQVLLAFESERGSVGCSNPTAARLVANLSSTRSYLIRVSGHRWAKGAYSLTRTIISNAPANDLCGNAIPVSTGQIVSGSTACAQDSFTNWGGCAFAQNSRDVWYTFTPSQSGTYNFNMCGSQTGIDYSAIMSVLASCSGPELQCSAYICPNGSANFNRSLVANTTYYLRVAYDNVGAPGFGPFQFVISPVDMIPSNDNCIFATQVPAAPFAQVPFNTTNSTQSAFSACLPANMTRDVWFSFTAPQRGQLTVATCGGASTLFDVGLTMFAGCSSSLIACSNTGGCSPNAAEISRLLQPNQSVVVRLSTAEQIGGQFNFIFSPRNCNDIDFNNDGSLFDPTDIQDFLSVFSEGPCSTASTTGCDGIDFNNDGSLFDPLDIESFLSVFSEGPCI